MSGGGFEELLNEARRRLSERDDQGGGDLGDRVELDEGEAFRGRWRGLGVMNTRDGEALDVFLLWDEDGRPRFHYRNTNLIDEVADADPQVGDDVVIVRGEDVEFEKQGELRTMHRFAVRARPSTKPLPGGASAGEGSPGGGSPSAPPRDDIPFFWIDGYEVL